MELKTKVEAQEGKQEVMITREFDLPLDLLFKAYTEPELLEQWMGTKVLKLENKKHGSYEFHTTDAKGNVYAFSGVVHEFSPDYKITRTFEMAYGDTLTGPQLEFLEFESLNTDSSKLTMHIIHKSVAHRNGMLQRGMGQGMSRAHDRLQDIVNKLK